MSNIYIQEPPALGKVLLKTSAGDIDIELWTKEAPKACRNFIQLCMEGYYNGTIFHRVVPGFIVQGGDPNGDGTGGESVYGAPFKDEFHSRLRFNRRGLVAMANAGKDDNGSQFFFTLAATPELQNKHTIFGKVTGETIYNILKLTEGLIGPDDRPEHPHRITGADVIINPFEDIVPRVVEKPVEAPKKKKKERQGVKNFGLLSFGEEAEEDEGEALEYKGKPKSTHDLLEDPKLSKKTAAELEQEEQEQLDREETTEEAEERRQKTEAAVTSIRDKLRGDERRDKREASPDEESRKRQKEDSESDGEYYLGKERDMERKKERDRIRNEIKQLKKEMRAPKDEPVKDEEERQTNKMEEDNEMYKQYVEEQERYKKMKEKIPKKGTARSRRTKTKKTKKKQWVKNLYENRDYPDNYTDKKFLEDLRKNVYIQKVTLSQAIEGSFRVTLRLCLCVLYAVIYVYMYNKYAETKTVIYFSTFVTVMCHLLYLYVERTVTYSHFKTVLVYVVLGYLLSPILHTLTDTVSTDTIYAWAVIMMMIHLIFFDYEVPVALVSKSLSINAAVFASVCLVSRLSTPFDAFILLTISVILFVLSPQLFKVILHTRLFHLLFSVTLLVTFVSLYSVSFTLFCYFILVVVILSFYFPVLFVRWQKYKDNIYGPWDEAIINDSDDLDELVSDVA